MGRPTGGENKTEKMSVYFNPKKAAEQKTQETEEELREIAAEEERYENSKRLASTLFQLFVDPLIIMLLWNWFIPGIFGLAVIGYWQGFGLCWMSRILFQRKLF